MSSLIVIIVLLAVTWLLLIRPQRRRQVTQANLLSNLTVGDEIVTAGGLIGHIEAIDDDEVELRIAPGTVVRVAKRAVAAVIPEDDEDDEPTEDEDVDELSDDVEADGAAGEPATGENRQSTDSADEIRR